MGEITGDIKAEAIEYAKKTVKNILSKVLRFGLKELVNMIKIAVVSAVISYIILTTSCKTIEDLIGRAVPDGSGGITVEGTVDLDEQPEANLNDGYWKQRYRELDEAYLYVIKERNDQIDKYVNDMNAKDDEIQRLTEYYDDQIAQLHAINEGLRGQLEEIKSLLDNLGKE